MTEFTTLREETYQYGKNNFLEVTRKKVTDGGDEHVFLSIAKGDYNESGKSYQTSCTIPDSDDAVDWVIENLPKMLAPTEAEPEK